MRINDLRSIGILNPQDLKGQDGIKLSETLKRISHFRHDPCVADTFLATVDFMNGAKAKPWWTYTDQRKKIFKTQYVAWE